MSDCKQWLFCSWCFLVWSFCRTIAEAPKYDAEFLHASAEVLSSRRQCLENFWVIEDVSHSGGICLLDKEFERHLTFVEQLASFFVAGCLEFVEAGCDGRNVIADTEDLFAGLVRGGLVFG